MFHSLKKYNKIKEQVACGSIQVLMTFGKHLVESKDRVCDTEEHEHLMTKNTNFAPHRERLGSACL